MRRYHIAVLPGDGIGPEVMDVAVRVLEAATAGTGSDGFKLDFVPHSAGAKHYRRTGSVLPADVLDDCLKSDAVLLAAVGLPDVRLPDNTEVQPEIMVGLRRALGLYAAVRPIRLYPGAPTPLKDVGPGIDFVIIRENLEGLFASYGGGCVVGDQVATDTLVITRAGTERVVEFAFRLAERRNGRPLDGRRLVTCVDKANIFRSLAFFRKVFFEVAARHPDVAAEAVYVDAMSLYMVQNPQGFDVLVMENQFGDILSDLGAGLVGGLGLAPSAELGEEHALFQPSHGTAPQLAGQNVANPLAMILSAAMMLDWLGERDDVSAAVTAGRRIESAVARVLKEGTTLTADLGGRAGTTTAGEAVLRQLEVA
ncbi:MAG TPA: isocitrate/isopropylmalate dehydrogenase family protein [Planctomycetaceae bacterium]|nr:isocitrate/isopropylmalate dehydrogenase family protein [Planctomycetaceae bacterium]